MIPVSPPILRVTPMVVFMWETVHGAVFPLPRIRPAIPRRTLMRRDSPLQDSRESEWRRKSGREKGEEKSHGKGEGRKEWEDWNCRLVFPDVGLLQHETDFFLSDSISYFSWEQLK